MFAALKKSANAVIDDVHGVLEEYQSADPHTVGLARQAVGEVLVQDGTKGLANAPEGEKTRPALTNAFVFVFVGLLFSGIGAMAFTSAPETDSTTTGTVQRVVENHRTGNSGRTCSLVVAFTVGERDYTASSDVRSSSDCRRQVGDQVEVRYSAANPAENESGSQQSTFGLLFGGFGALAAVAGLWATGVAWRNVAFGRQLIREGEELTATYPAAPHGDAVVAEAREKVTALLLSKRGGGKKFTPFDLSSDSESAPVATTGRATGDSAGDTEDRPEPDVRPAVQPGWYPTADGRHVRWYDGSAWTDHVQPMPPSN